MQTYEKTLYKVCPPEHRNTGFHMVNGRQLFLHVRASTGAARETLATLYVITAFGSRLLD